jgi:hypothetical protein
LDVSDMTCLSLRVGTGFEKAVRPGSPCAGMIRIRFDGRSFDRSLSARHTGLPCFVVQPSPSAVAALDHR